MLNVAKRSYLPESDTRNYIMNGSTHYRTIDFINITPHQIVIIDRQNIPVILPAAPTGTLMNPPRLEVRSHYQFFDSESIREMKAAVNYINTQLATIGEERKILKDAITEADQNGQTRHLCFTSIRKIPLEDLQNTNSLFDQASGFVVTINGAHLVSVHPESVEGRMVGNYEDYVKSRPVGILFEIIDNENMIKERFTYACNTVLRLPAIKDINRTSGIYVSNIRDVGQTTSITDTICYTLLDAEKKFGLYCTKEEALTNGNPELIAKSLVERTKLELEEFKNKVSIGESENRQLESEYKRRLLLIESEQKEKMLIMETDNKVKTAEILKLKEEIDRRKLIRDEFYESRSQERKDTSEMIKFIPAVLIGFIGAAVIFRK